MLAAAGVGSLRADNEASQPLVIEIKTAQVAVVGSMAELKKQPQLVVAGVPVRIGIESAKVPLGGGVLAYCLWEPEKDRVYTGTGSYRSAQLGPLTVRVTQTGVATTTIQQRLDFTPTDPGEAQVAVAPIKAQVAGKCEVEFCSLDGTVVAHATVEAVKDAGPVWYPLRPANEAKGANPATLSATVTVAPFAALPRWPTNAVGKAEEPWRTFVPAAADPDLQAAVADGKLTLAAKGPLNVNSAGTNLLTRWWVNGAPATLAAKGARVLSPAQQPVLMNGDVKMELKLDGVTDALGAKPGDKVEVEVLYSWYGWDYSTSAVSRIIQPGERSAASPVKLSNRAGFVVPAKP